MPTRLALISIEVEALGESHPDVAESRTNLAQVLLARGADVQAREQLELAWVAYDDDTNAPRELRAEVAFELARLLVDRDAATRERARELAATALVIYEQASPTAAEAHAKVDAWLHQRL